MPFIEQEAKSEYKKIDGKRTHVITPEVEVTLTNTQTTQTNVIKMTASVLQTSRQ